MRRILLSVMLLGSILSACAGSMPSISTAPAIPSQPSAIPSATLVLNEKAPALLAETDLDTQTGTAYSLDWSPDGETLAVASGVEIILLSSDLEETLAILKPSSGALTATWSSDQKKFATVVGFRNSTISIWDWDPSTFTLTLAQEISAGSDQYGASWSPDGKLLATLANDRKSTIQIWDKSTWEMLHKFDLPYENPRRALNWSADSKTLFDAGELDGQLVVFGLNVANGEVQDLATLPLEQVFAVGISPDVEKFAVADEQGKVQIFDVISSDLLMEFQSVSQPVGLAWNPNGTSLAILGYKTALQLWKVVR